MITQGSNFDIVMIWDITITLPRLWYTGFLYVLCNITITPGEWLICSVQQFPIHKLCKPYLETLPYLCKPYLTFVSLTFVSLTLFTALYPSCSRGCRLPQNRYYYCNVPSHCPEICNKKKKWSGPCLKGQTENIRKKKLGVGDWSISFLIDRVML